MSTFLRERANGVADHVIAAILLSVGSAMLGFLAKLLARSLGVSPALSYVIGVAAFLLIAFAVSLLLKPKGRKNGEEEVRGSVSVSPTISPITSPTISPTI